MAVSSLLPHQQQIHDFIVTRACAGVFVRVGAAKTLSTLAALMTARPAGHVLVVAPKNIARSTWLDEIDKWGIPVRAESFVVDIATDKELTREERLAKYEALWTTPPSVWFIGQDLLKDLVEQMPVKSVRNGRAASGRWRYRKEIQWPFTTLVVDESQGFKNSQAEKFKALAKVVPAMTRRILLTGTPTPNGLLDLWAQVYLLDEGAALGRSFTEYRERYFRPTLVVDGKPVKWEILPGAAEQIYGRIGHLVMSVENTSMPLPPRLEQELVAHLPDDVLEGYRDFKRDAVMELVPPGTGRKEARSIVAANAAVLRAKLLQYASGTMYLPEVDDAGDPIDYGADQPFTTSGGRTPYAVVHDEKVKLLDWAIRNASGNAMVLYRYRSDRAELEARLAELGHSVRTFDGSRGMIQDWNAGRIPVMLLQPASAGHGLNLQDGGRDAIWYTLPDSLEHWIQANGRLHRLGQGGAVTITTILAADTLDMKQPLLLAAKEAVQEGLVAAVDLDRAEAEAVLSSVEDVLGDLDLYPL